MPRIQLDSVHSALLSEGEDPETYSATGRRGSGMAEHRKVCGQQLVQQMGGCDMRFRK